MFRFKFPILLITSLSLVACSKIAEGGDDEAGGDVPPQDNYNQPGWIPAAARLADSNNKTLPGFENSVHELEYAAFAPSVFAHPNADVSAWVDANLADPTPKPWIWGMPDLTQAPPRDGMHEPNPFYQMMSFAHLTGQQLNDYLSGVVDYVPENLPATNPVVGLRSGLVGNNALYLQGAIPSTHPRPPIVWMNLLALATHPFYAGRSNALGQPCSTATGAWEDLLWGDDANMAENQDEWNPGHPAADCRRGVHYYGIHQVSSAFPLAPDPNESVLPEVLATATCLDNGGEYEVYNGDLVGGEYDSVLGNGAVLSAFDRNGLVWVNTTELVKLFETLATQAPAPFDQLFVVLDILQDGGFNWFGWAVDPPFRPSMWSTTGECAYKAAIEIDSSCDWWTTVACPKHMLPVLPEFNKTAMSEACVLANVGNDAFDPQTIEGYCTFPIWGAPPGAAAPTQPPFWGVNIKPVDNSPQTGLGIPNGYVIDMSELLNRLQLDAETSGSERAALASWYADVTTDVGFADVDDGVRLDPLTTAGRGFLASLDFTKSDVITSIGWGDQSIRRPTTAALAMAVAQSFDAGELVMFEVEEPSGIHRFVYLFPTFVNMDSLETLWLMDTTDSTEG
jgi:hypothetical protein